MLIINLIIFAFFFQNNSIKNINVKKKIFSLELKSDNEEKI